MCRGIARIAGNVLRCGTDGICERSRITDMFEYLHRIREFVCVEALIFTITSKCQ